VALRAALSPKRASAHLLLGLAAAKAALRYPLPGETRELTAAYSTEHLPQPKPVVEVEGWNVNAKVIEPD
jgi:hypothetical protein